MDERIRELAVACAKAADNSKIWRGFHQWGHMAGTVPELSPDCTLREEAIYAQWGYRANIAILEAWDLLHNCGPRESVAVEHQVFLVGDRVYGTHRGAQWSATRRGLGEEVKPFMVLDHQATQLARLKRDDYVRDVLRYILAAGQLYQAIAGYYGFEKKHVICTVENDLLMAQGLMWYLKKGSMDNGHIPMTVAAAWISGASAMDTLSLWENERR